MTFEKEEDCSDQAELCKNNDEINSDLSSTAFWPILRDHPPSIPTQLLRKLTCKDACGIGKVKVLLKISRQDVPQDNSIQIDIRKKTVTLFDPGSDSQQVAGEKHSRVGIVAPKVFSFDAIFEGEDSQAPLCATALNDVIVAVIRGTDGAVFSYGQPNLGQTQTMLGSPESASNLGIIPCGINWLYQALEEHKANTGTRYSVRMSALQIGINDVVTDLLRPYENDEQSPGVFLMENQRMNSTMLPQAAEIRSPTIEKACHLLDSALKVRQIDNAGKSSHLILTFNIYQYSVDSSGKGGVAGGRSRLHLIDFGAMNFGKSSTTFTTSALGNVLLAIFNGQKHLPYKDSKLSRLIHECLGSLRCVASMVVHISPRPEHYQETLITVQLASRVHRLRRKRAKPNIGGSGGSGGSSGESRCGKSSRGTITESASSSVDPSSSEQSCDTVIYIGPGTDEFTDGEHPPVFIPSMNSGDNGCSIKKVLKDSCIDMPESYENSNRSANFSKLSSPQSKHTKSPKRTNKKDSPKKFSSNTVVTNNDSPQNHCPQSPNRNSCLGTPPNSGCLTPKSARAFASKRHKSHKIKSIQDTHETSEEQWIDGPKVSRYRVYDGHRSKTQELETWIDGPEATYGYMDDHKKSMIQKWVETQNVQIPSSPKTPQYKELTQFKTSDTLESPTKHKSTKDKRKTNEFKELKDSKVSTGITTKEREAEKTVVSTSDTKQVLVKKTSNPKSKQTLVQPNPEKTDIFLNKHCDSKNVEIPPLPNEKPHQKGALNSSSENPIKNISDSSSNQCPEKTDIPETPEEILEVVRVENDTGDIQTAIRQKIAQEIVEYQETHVQENKDASGSSPSYPWLQPQNNSFESDEILLDTQKRVFFGEAVHYNLENLDEEAEEELNLALDRWLVDEEREFIEVVEPSEPAEMVDSWVQVTEEDLERTFIETGMSYLPYLHPSGILPILPEDPLENSENQDLNLPVLLTSDLNRPDMSINYKNLQTIEACQPSDAHGSSRYEQMIRDPNFTAKTHYFAKRLEELRCIHDLYRNLAKQSPRGRVNTPSQYIVSQSEDYIIQPTLEQSSTMDIVQTNQITENSLDLNWKSLLPEEIITGYGDMKIESDDSSSEISRDNQDPINDIQSDIMPYLPSTYMNISTDGTTEKEPETNTHNEKISTEEKSNNNIPTDSSILKPQVTQNCASLSDDEINVKNVQVKKEKKKRKLSLLSKNKNSIPIKKSELELETPNNNSKLGWIRIFGTTKTKTSSKSNKPSKSVIKSSIKSSDKTEKKAIKEKPKEIKTTNKETKKDSRNSSQESDRSRPADKSIKSVHHETDKHAHNNSKHGRNPSKKVYDQKTGSSPVSRGSKGSSKHFPIQMVPPQGGSPSKKKVTQTQSSSWDVGIAVHHTSSPNFVPGYDSGNDSGVGLKVTPRRQKSTADSRHGESSGYDSVIRDSECSSFGSSQDSGLDDDTHKSKSITKNVPASVSEEPPTTSEATSSENIEVPSIKDSTSLELQTVPESVALEEEALINELVQFDETDMVRYEGHRTEEDIVKCRRTQEKIRALREKQCELKKELEAAKWRLSIDKSRWSYELHVEECMDFRDDGFLEALEQETLILSKRVVAARSRTLIATSFDTNCKSQCHCPPKSYRFDSSKEFSC